MIPIEELKYQIKHRIGRDLPSNILKFISITCKDINHALNIAFSYDRQRKNNYWKNYDW